MDILGHDILNNNQAVLGYLELILAEPTLDKKARKYAEKAVPHIRTSTLLVENIKKVLASRGLDPSSLKSLDLMTYVSSAEKELQEFFPDRKVKVSVTADAKAAWVTGNIFVKDLVYNALVDMVKLDTSKNVRISARLAERLLESHECWSLRLENTNAALPPIMRGKDIESVYAEDSSTAVRMTGMIFAKMITSTVGGDFEAEELEKEGERRGAAFTITLRKADGK
jgi:hypothetical protein